MATRFIQKFDSSTATGAFLDRGSSTAGALGSGAAAGVGIDVGDSNRLKYNQKGTIATLLDSILGALVSAATGAVGFVTGAGGAVTQATSKSTGVTLNKPTGQITMNGAALAATTSVAFTLTNSQIAATDVVIVNLASANSANSYFVSVDAVAAGSCSISLRNYTAGSLSEAIVLNFVVIKGVAA